jgi:hypothetical protein
MTTQQSMPKKIAVTLEVANQVQAAELNAAWQEIVAGQRTRLNTAAEDVNEIMERARAGSHRERRRSGSRKHLARSTAY